MTVVVSRSHTVFCPRVELDKQDPCEGASCSSDITKFDLKREKWVAAGWTLVDNRDAAQMLDGAPNRVKVLADLGSLDFFWVESLAYLEPK